MFRSGQDARPDLPGPGPLPRPRPVPVDQPGRHAPSVGRVVLGEAVRGDGLGECARVEDVRRPRRPGGRVGAQFVVAQERDPVGRELGGAARQPHGRPAHPAPLVTDHALPRLRVQDRPEEHGPAVGIADQRAHVPAGGGHPVPGPGLAVFDRAEITPDQQDPRAGEVVEQQPFPAGVPGVLEHDRRVPSARKLADQRVQHPRPRRLGAEAHVAGHRVQQPAVLLRGRLADRQPVHPAVGDHPMPAGSRQEPPHAGHVPGQVAHGQGPGPRGLRHGRGDQGGSTAVESRDEQHACHDDLPLAGRGQGR